MALDFFRKPVEARLKHDWIFLYQAGRRTGQGVRNMIIFGTTNASHYVLRDIRTLTLMIWNRNSDSILYSTFELLRHLSEYDVQ